MYPRQMESNAARYTKYSKQQEYAYLYRAACCGLLLLVQENILTRSVSKLAHVGNHKIKLSGVTLPSNGRSGSKNRYSTTEPCPALQVRSPLPLWETWTYLNCM
jgi:hypothetical protein